jgi:cytochrome c1
MAVVKYGNVFWKFKHTDYDAEDYSEDESVRGKSQNRLGVARVQDVEARASSSSKSAIRSEVDESTACDEEGNNPDDDTVRQKNSADGSPSVMDGSSDKTEVSNDSTASADNTTDWKVQFAKSFKKCFLLIIR